jgi:hypothetical protein
MAVLEFGGTVPAGHTQIEWLTTLPPPDSTTPLSPSSSQIEFAAALQCDALLPLEWQGSAAGSLVANSAAYLEWLARRAGDAALSGEALRRALGEALVLLEDLSAGLVAARGDSPIPLEVTTPVRADAGLSTCWALSVSLTADTSLPFALAGAAPAPAPAVPQVSGRRLRLFRV